MGERGLMVYRRSVVHHGLHARVGQLGRHAVAVASRIGNRW